MLTYFYFPVKSYRRDSKFDSKRKIKEESINQIGQKIEQDS